MFQEFAIVEDDDQFADLDDVHRIGVNLSSRSESPSISQENLLREPGDSH